MGPVSVLGLGSWGSALAEHLSRKGVTVVRWSRREGSLDAALQASCIIVALPSSVLHEYARKLASCSHATIVSAIKGFDSRTRLTPLQLIASHASTPPALCVLSGPSFAADVLSRRPCGIVAGSASIQTADAVAELFSDESMRVYSSDDPLGVELGGAVKNVIALAAGVSDGLDLGDSARAAILTRGLAEMMRLAETMGARRETLSGLSGLGDLIMTGSSMTSRNYRVGYLLGQGQPLSKIIAELGSVSEGVNSTPIVQALSRSRSVEMPITEAVWKLIRRDITPQEMVQSLMLRPRRKEF